MTGNIGVELNLAVGRINRVLPDFILPTFITCSKNSMLKNITQWFWCQTISALQSFLLKPYINWHY